MNEPHRKASFRIGASRGHLPGEQRMLFTEEALLASRLPSLRELRPAANLSALFDECHNYIYANEGLLKDKIFHEIVKLLIMKLHDEQNANEYGLRFGITAEEYAEVRANRRSAFDARLEGLFAELRNRYGTLLSDNTLRLSPLTLAHVVDRLQYINLGATPGDVKGEAFQAFVYRHQRGDRGEFFTPHPIVRLAVEMVSPKPDERIIDPACGSGGFLIKAISYVCGTDNQVDRSAYVAQHVRGIEFNPDIALSAMIRLAFEGGRGSEVACANALINDVEYNEAFDIVLTNPPFGSKGKVENQRILRSYTLARRWARTSENEWEATSAILPRQSPEILFIERCLQMLRPGGRMAIVLPEGLLENTTNAHIRGWIRSQASVLAVVSIPQDAFVPYGTGIKTSLLVLQKTPASSDRVFMAHIRRIGYDVKGQVVYRHDDAGRLDRDSAGVPVIDDDIDEIAAAYRTLQDTKGGQGCAAFGVLERELNSRLDVKHYLPEDGELLDNLKTSGSRPLGEIADIISEAADFRLRTDSEIRYLAISDVDARTMQVISQQIIKTHEAPSRATYRLCKGDIITAISGASTGTPRQATAFITEEEDGAICSNGFAVLRNIRGVEPLFLLAYMRTGHYLRQVRRLMTGHAIPAISTGDLAKVLVPVPSLDVQRNISNMVEAMLAMRREASKIAQKAVNEAEALIDGTA